MRQGGAREDLVWHRHHILTLPMLSTSAASPIILILTFLVARSLARLSTLRAFDWAALIRDHLRELALALCNYNSTTVSDCEEIHRAATDTLRYRIEHRLLWVADWPMSIQT